MNSSLKLGSVKTPDAAARCRSTLTGRGCLRPSGALSHSIGIVTKGGRPAPCPGPASRQGGRRRASLIVRADGDSGSASKDEYQYEFGKPAAPKETWQRFKNEARQSLIDEMAKSEWDTDVVNAALSLACEDDAANERSVVKLPTDSYSKRLDKMVDELRRIHLPQLESASPKEVLDCIDNYLYNLQRFKLAEGVLEVYSPYRMYMHHVLAQKCGTALALGAVHLGVLQRLQASGELEGVKFELVLPVTGNRPFARVAPEPESSTGAAPGIILTPHITVLMLLDSLKRSFWPWEWPLGAKSGFLPAAEAAIGTSGRIGTANSTTGVLQASGRPFGDLNRSLLAAERLVLLNASSFHMRDTGILLYHLQRYEEAYGALRTYQEKSSDEAEIKVPVVDRQKSLGGIKAELEMIAEERALVDQVVAKLERMKAESSWAL